MNLNMSTTTEEWTEKIKRSFKFLFDTIKNQVVHIPSVVICQRICHKSLWLTIMRSWRIPIVCFLKTRMCIKDNVKNRVGMRIQIENPYYICDCLELFDARSLSITSTIISDFSFFFLGLNVLIIASFRLRQWIIEEKSCPNQIYFWKFSYKITHFSLYIKTRHSR